MNMRRTVHRLFTYVDTVKDIINIAPDASPDPFESRGELIFPVRVRFEVIGLGSANVSRLQCLLYAFSLKP